MSYSLGSLAFLKYPKSFQCITDVGLNTCPLEFSQYEYKYLSRVRKGEKGESGADSFQDLSEEKMEKT